MDNRKLSVTQLYTLYHSDNDNNDFHEYVDKYCKTRGIELHEAMLHKIVELKAQDILGILKVGDSPYV